MLKTFIVLLLKRITVAIVVTRNVNQAHALEKGLLIKEAKKKNGALKKTSPTGSLGAPLPTRQLKGTKKRNGEWTHKCSRKCTDVTHCDQRRRQ